MITESFYSKHFEGFLSSDKYENYFGNKSFDEGFLYLEKEFDYKSKFSESDFLDVEYGQDSVINELKAWRKFDKNQWRKVSIRKAEKFILDSAEELREFRQYLTRGELGDWVRRKLIMFGDEKLLTAEGLLTRAINNKIRQLTGLPTVDALKNTMTFITKISKGVLNTDSRNKLLKEVSSFVFNGVQSELTEDVAAMLKKRLTKSVSQLMTPVGRKKLTNWLFDNIVNTGMWVDQQDLTTGTITELLKTKWTEFVRKQLFKKGKNTPINREDVFNIAIEMFKDVGRDFASTENIFKFNLRDSLFKTINKQMSPLNFSSNLKKNIRVLGRHSFRQGLLSLGLDPKEFGPVERILISQLSNLSDPLVNKLTNKILSGTLNSVNAILAGETWTNRTLGKFFQLGVLAGDRNGLYEWVYGDTKHCGSCAFAHGQRHRLKDWWNAGIIPQNHGHKELICGGFHCKCKLVRVTGTANTQESKNRLDRIPLSS